MSQTPALDPPAAATPGVLTRTVFTQDVYWADLDGERHDLTQMSQSHLRNVLRMLERRSDQLFTEAIHAERYAELQLSLTGYYDVPGSRADVSSLTEVTAEQWLAATPLVIRIRELLAGTADAVGAR